MGTYQSESIVRQTKVREKKVSSGSCHINGGRFWRHRIASEGMSCLAYGLYSIHTEENVWISVEPSEIWVILDITDSLVNRQLYEELKGSLF